MKRKFKQWWFNYSTDNNKFFLKVCKKFFIRRAWWIKIRNYIIALLLGYLIIKNGTYGSGDAYPFNTCFHVTPHLCEGLYCPIFCFHMSLLVYVRVYIAQPSVFMSLLIYVRVYIAQPSVFMSLLVYVRVYIAQPSVFITFILFMAFKFIVDDLLCVLRVDKIFLSFVCSCHDYTNWFNNNLNIREHNVPFMGLGLWCLMPLSTIFQLYRGGVPS